MTTSTTDRPGLQCQACNRRVTVLQEGFGWLICERCAAAVQRFLADMPKHLN